MSSTNRPTQLLDNNGAIIPHQNDDDQYVGYYTPLDKMFHEGETRPISANPLDNNWGGPRYSEDAVNRGEYRSDQILVNNKN